MATLGLDSSSAFSTNVPRRSWEVFLNFRGIDIGKSFIGFLHKALVDRRINVYLDRQRLETGEPVGPSLREAIKGSKIYIPIFSEHYADSKWCLGELSLIVECCRSNDQLKIIPIFFHVQPSDVEHQTGSFKDAFRNYEDSSDVGSWREAMNVVGSWKEGVTIEETDDQVEKVKFIVKRVLGELANSTRSDECEYHVGMDSRVEKVLYLLNSGSNDVQFVGICGYGGIGKTTIARAVYNRIFLTFDGDCFLPEIRKQAKQSMGLVSLQKQLLKEILKIDFDIADHQKGKTLIKQRLRNLKVIIVLDDVDSKEQIDALVGKPNWFGQGSKIIIVSKDEYILNVATVDEEKIYWPQKLDDKQSLQLFCKHAFSADQPLSKYARLSKKVASYSGGLPLTLEAFGSYLLDDSSIKVWKRTIRESQNIPKNEVQKTLKISYDTLESDQQKAIFLDAACFFIGWEKKMVISIWKACGYYPKSAIKRLTKRSLLKFECADDNEYYLKMDDVIQDMGRNIVLEESCVGKRSRLRSRDEIWKVLEEHDKGSDMIRGIIFPLNAMKDCVSNEDFEKMSSLIFLQIHSRNFKGDFSRLPSSLRWFKWVGNHLDIPPNKFYHTTLVHLLLLGNDITQAWNIKPHDENKLFQELKVLDLCFCRNLSKSPNFSWFPCLERLDFTKCFSLEELDESIGKLRQLKILILRLCKSLKKLPESIGYLKSLVKLDLFGTQIKQLPLSISRLTSLKELILMEYNSLKMLPESIGVQNSLANIEESLTEYEKLEYGRLENKKFPKQVMRQSSLMEIFSDLLGRSIPKIPHDFSLLSKLKQLFIFQCKTLESIPELPSSLVELRCQKCYSLIRLPDLSILKLLTKLELNDCEKLEEIRGLEGAESLEELDARGCYKLTFNPRNKHYKVTPLKELRSNDSNPDERYNLAGKKGLRLRLVYKCSSKYIMRNQGLKQCRLPSIFFDIDASIIQKDKKIRCRYTLRIEDVFHFLEEDIVYIHHFNGFYWFGIPLEGKDAIENLKIVAPTPRLSCICIPKFWEILFEEQ